MDQNPPVTITTFPFTLGPLESAAIFFRIGMVSNLPWSPIGATSCSLSAASLRFAAAVILICSQKAGILAKERDVERREEKGRNPTPVSSRHSDAGSLHGVLVWILNRQKLGVGPRDSEKPIRPSLWRQGPTSSESLLLPSPRKQQFEFRIPDPVHAAR
jgi:hypothetical protein